ncbi:MAG: polyprenyl synthetase family protein [Kiritimatiellae bacterium]|jgi:geranylgeranyl diphosphate synthase type II|nr:polyprenyl synthetase family protein [Kiritimatiellia bacterium]MDD2347676.1 polyprenyl synthetase family protein [Kiritimatiellia bacterium]MDD3583648.1 polyprenyl synthetase family protein [Kiritimatiellia bacterium]HHU14567.1 polyprenyl synthetase family protein [Lentisphaerota bacterium]
MPFVLETYLADRKRAVEEHLFASLPAAETRPAILVEAMRHAVLSGGKRLRPILCLAAAEAVGGSAEDARYAATAVELLHTYTLVHDDLPCMDNDLLRRGQPTVHARYGEAIAVLTGDALQTLAFEMLANTPERRPGTVARLVKELAAVVGFAGVIGGQVEDIRFAAAPTRDVIDFVFQHKTADLFKAACRLGALAAGGDEDAVDKLSRFADALGFAFQIIDDLLDAPTASSDAAPELSCLAVMSADEAHDWAHSLTAQAVAALDGLPGETVPLAALANHLLTRII